MTDATWPYPNFPKAEVQCKCGCGLLPPHELMQRVQALRTEFGKPLIVSSGARCPKHNAAESHTGEDGPHTKGAMDFAIGYEDAFQLLALAVKHGATGIGVNQKGDKRFLHLDWLPNAPGQPRPRIWSY